MTPSTVAILAPNWLGDAIMAIPAVGDIRRKFPRARLVVAGRGSTSEIFRFTPYVDGTVPLHWRGQFWRQGVLEADAQRLRDTGAEVAILFPNSFASALLAYRAGIRERWGFAADMRGPLLTRVAARPTRQGHHVQYYQAMVHSLGMENGPMEPELQVGAELKAAARAELAARGWDGRSPMVVLAPGAAGGKAKQWIPANVARLCTLLAGDLGTTCVLVGSQADGRITAAIRDAVPEAARPRVIDHAGSSLDMLLGVMAAAQACVVNDSGPMHVAAALGTPLVALFGPTLFEYTRPLARPGGRAEVVTGRAWCRPCELKECPIDHRCMTSITPEQVVAALRSMQ